MSDSVLFGIDIVDSCQTAIIKPSELLRQEYTIFQKAFSYEFPSFETEPADCPVRYTYTVSNQSGESVVDFNSKLRQFYFGYSEDMSLAGDLYTDYKIEITATNDDDITTANEIRASFDLRIKNPCLDPDYVKIIPSILPEKTYTLGASKP